MVIYLTRPTFLLLGEKFPPEKSQQVLRSRRFRPVAKIRAGKLLRVKII